MIDQTRRILGTTTTTLFQTFSVTLVTLPPPWFYFQTSEGSSRKLLAVKQVYPVDNYNFRLFHSSLSRQLGVLNFTGPKFRERCIWPVFVHQGSQPQESRRALLWGTIQHGHRLRNSQVVADPRMTGTGKLNALQVNLRDSWGWAFLPSGSVSRVGFSAQETVTSVFLCVWVLLCSFVLTIFGDFSEWNELESEVKEAQIIWWCLRSSFLVSQEPVELRLVLSSYIALVAISLSSETCFFGSEFEFLFFVALSLSQFRPIFVFGFCTVSQSYYLRPLALHLSQSYCLLRLFSSS